MELTLERTHETAKVGDLDCTIWRIIAGDETSLGIACIAEIVAAPGTAPFCLTASQSRQLLACELRGDKPRMKVQPTNMVVSLSHSCRIGHARLWLGDTGEGMRIGAFIPAIAPNDPDLDLLFKEELAELTTNEQIVTKGELPRHIDGLGHDFDLPLR